MNRAVFNAISLVILAASGSFIAYRAVTWEPASSDSVVVTENETTNEAAHECWHVYSDGSGVWLGRTLDASDANLNNNTTDWDADDISDEDEALFGTSVCDWDTDRDLVSDFDEVYELFTDPLDNDTDNDTLLDWRDPAPLNASHDADSDSVLDQYDQWMDRDVVRDLVFDWNWNGTQVFIDIYVDSNLVFQKSIFDSENGSWTLADYDWPDNFSADPAVNFSIDGGGLNESSHILDWHKHPLFLLGAGRLTYHYTGSRGNLTIEVNH